MGCFLACFGSSKHDKRPQHSHTTPPHNPNFGCEYKPVPVINVAENEVNTEKLNARSRVKPHEEQLRLELVKPPEEQLRLTEQVNRPKEQLSSTEHVKPPEEELRLVECVKPPEQQMRSTERGRQEEQLSSGTRKKVTFDSNIREYEHVSVDEVPGNAHDDCEKGINQNCTTPGKARSASSSGSTVSSVGLYPPNHRYQNCIESDDDEEELDYGENDLGEDEDDNDYEEVDDDAYHDDGYHPRHEQEFSTRSCSSIESSTKIPATHEDNDGHFDSLSNSLSPEVDTKLPRFNRNARDRAGYVHSVLNPVQNTTQWKIVKAKGTTSLKQQKENLQIDTNFELSTAKSKPILDEPKYKNEVAVDASLSNWLISSQKTPPNKATPIDLEPISSGASFSSHDSNSMKSQERPILGALTMEELQQLSATSAIRKSPTLSPDKKPLMGMVGVHWIDRTPTESSVSTSSFKGIPNTTSKYREDKMVNWHSTPFEKRLERALNSGTAEAYGSHHLC